jgi:hypothetical protein
VQLCGCISEVRDVVDFYHPGQCCFGKKKLAATSVWTRAFGRPHLHFLSRAPTLYHVRASLPTPLDRAWGPLAPLRRLRPLGGALANVVGGYGWWVPLQHV